MCDDQRVIVSGIVNGIDLRFQNSMKFQLIVLRSASVMASIVNSSHRDLKRFLIKSAHLFIPLNVSKQPSVSCCIFPFNLTHFCSVSPKHYSVGGFFILFFELCLVSLFQFFFLRLFVGKKRNKKKKIQEKISFGNETNRRLK